MSGETDIFKLIKEMEPVLNQGEYVFSTVKNLHVIDREDTLFEFKEQEGVTVVLEKTKANELNLDYSFIASWITLMIHSSLDAVGLTAIFSTELAKNGISCNVVAGFYHDHIFVNQKDTNKAMKVLMKLSKQNHQNLK